MASYSSLSVTIGIVVVVLTFLWQKYFSASRFGRLPPGPKPGLFGTKLPPVYFWRHWKEWSKDYGPVFTIWSGNTPMFVVNTYETAQDLLERRGAVPTAGRPRSIAAGEIISGNMRILFVNYGDTWRKMRRALHAALQPGTVLKYGPRQELSARNLIVDILDKPNAFRDHCRRFAVSVITNVAYGKTTPTYVTDPDIVQLAKCMKTLTDQTLPSSYSLDSLPFLKYVPGYLNKLHAAHKEEHELFCGQLQNVKTGMESNQVDECFGTFILNSMKDYDINFSQASYLCGSLYGAGSETTAATISISIMAAAAYPEVQTWLQEELDRVVGDKRPPTFTDFADTPRVAAWVNEVLRWRSTASGGFAHRLVDDLTWNGYVLPKGCLIIGNHWAIQSDPTVYNDPDNFVPQRWLTKDNEGNEVLRKDLKLFAFGFGRRVCPGSHIASRSVQICTANLLWAFRICKPIDPETNEEKDIDTLAFTNIPNSAPLPFKVRFVERFEGAAKIYKDLDMI